MKITVIGAGLGGLTFAAEAVRDGHEVVIYDKNSKPGGVVALLEHEGYKFEQTIYAMDGRLVKMITAIGGICSISLNELSAGLYLVSFNNTTFKFTKK